MPSGTPISFARIKIQPPRFRASLIERGDLEERLGTALLSCRLVLLVAAAGYGKTAAMSRQVSKLPPACASVWITMDEHDDLRRFLACLLDALEVHDPPWRVAPESLVERVSKEAELRPVIDELVNALAAVPVEHGVIALDDMHMVADHRIYGFLELLLQRAPPNWTLAIATRKEPELPLARLRAHRELAEFGPSDLSFTQQEIRLLWSAAGQDDSHATAQQLLDRTQGWVAGLCLTLDVARRSGAPADDRRLSQRHLFEYLASEVFEQMSEEWREFLMRCSVLPELSEARCATVTGNPRAGEMLEEIERRGVFVSVLDSQELTLRSHDLFRDFLDDRLRREHPEEIPQLLRRAAEGETDPARKVDMLLRAGACREAEVLLCEIAPILLAQGDSAQLTRLLERFPKETRADSPRLLFTRGLKAMSDIDPAAVKLMDEAAIGFEREGDSLRMWRARAHQAYSGVIFLSHSRQIGSIVAALEQRHSEPDLETELANAARVHQASFIHGPQNAISQHLACLTDLLERSTSPALWFRFLPLLEMHFAVPGARALAERLVSGALTVAGERYLPLQLQARSVEASLLLWNGRVAEAETRIEQLQADEKWAGRAGQSLYGSWGLKLITFLLRGDGAALQATTRDRTFFDRMERLELGVMGIIGMAMGNWPLVGRAISNFESDQDMSDSYWDIFIPVLKARLALQERRDEDALKLLREPVKTSSDIDRVGFNAMVRIFLAIAELRTGAAAAAWRTIEPLVNQVRDSGEVLGVLFCGPDPLAELAGSRWSGDVPRDGLAQLQQWARLSQSLRKGTMPIPADAAPVPPEAPLSAREFEVLTHIAAGDSNKLIARALDLSPHTVKRHVARILERLDLASRGEAAAWYHTRPSEPAAA